jgi:hypothetical protein
MKPISSQHDVFPKVKNVYHILCLERSKDREILYIGFRLTSDKARESSPVMICNAQDFKLIGQQY